MVSEITFLQLIKLLLIRVTIKSLWIWSINPIFIRGICPAFAFISPLRCEDIGAIRAILELVVVMRTICKLGKRKKQHLPTLLLLKSIYLFHLYRYRKIVRSSDGLTIKYSRRPFSS